MLTLIWEGMALGFSVAMPVGPIGVLCIRNSLSYGMRGGFVSGLGAACADLFYGGVAILALETVSTLLECHMAIVQLLGAIVLCGLGIWTFFAKAAAEPSESSGQSSLKLFLTTCLLTLTNPMTLFAFMGIYAAVGIDCGSWFPDAMLLMCGLFLGSALWWLFLSFVASRFREKIDRHTFIWINRISGAVIFAFGLFALVFVTA